VESIYPTWVLDELPHWGENGIVLIGDAAHAMDPTTGQGASQALEDSQTLSLLLKEVLQVEGERRSLPDAEKDKVDLAIKLFYEVRNPRVREIVQRGKKISGRKANVGVVAEYFMYFFLWMMNRFPWIGELQVLLRYAPKG
jgi:2-polyprenyl-6-methoxyphenol hydroxylase-like FAD-dependent oxidoreductase